MKKSLAALVIAAPLAACQTTAGPDAVGLSRLEAAGFVKSGNTYVCQAARCGQPVVLAYKRGSITFDHASFTAEELVKSKLINRGAAERLVSESMNSYAGPTHRFSLVRFDQRNASFMVKGVRKQGTTSLHMAGKLSFRGNDMVGQMAVSPSAALAARYLSLAPAE